MKNSQSKTNPKLGNSKTSDNNNKSNPITNAKLNSFTKSQQSRVQVLQDKNSRIKHIKSRRSPIVKKKSPSKSQTYDQSYDEYDNIRMINQSMIELQDPKFISHQIDDFQSRLQMQQKQQLSKVKGFCQVTREQSLKLSNTEAYRKYKKQIKQSNKKQKEIQNSKDNIKDKEKEKEKKGENGTDKQKKQQINKTKKDNKQQNQKIQKTLGEEKCLDRKNQSQSSESSLSYSSDSRQRYSKKVLKNQSLISLENNHSDLVNQAFTSDRNKLNNESTISQQYGIYRQNQLQNEQKNTNEQVNNKDLQKNQSI